jgi:hypothetical protein
VGVPGAAKALGLEARRGHPTHDAVGLKAVLNEVFDGDERQVVAGREGLQVGHAGHRAVVVHDLADDAGGGEAREAREVDAALGLTRTLEHAPGPRPQREDVSGRHEVFGAALGRGGHADGVGPVGGRDARGDALAGLDAHGKRGLQRGLVFLHHHGEAQAVNLLLGEGEADEAAGFAGHEVDGLGRHLLRGEHDVALVFAVFVVGENHHTTLADRVDGAPDALLRGALQCHRGCRSDAVRGRMEAVEG